MEETKYSLYWVTPTSKDLERQGMTEQEAMDYIRSKARGAKWEGQYEMVQEGVDI
jgi:hypothetical protein